MSNPREITPRTAVGIIIYDVTVCVSDPAGSWRTEYPCDGFRCWHYPDGRRKTILRVIGTAANDIWTM